MSDWHTLQEHEDINQIFPYSLHNTKNEAKKQLQNWFGHRPYNIRSHCEDKARLTTKGIHQQQQQLLELPVLLSRSCGVRIFWHFHHPRLHKRSRSKMRRNSKRRFSNIPTIVKQNLPNNKS